VYNYVNKILITFEGNGNFQVGYFKNR